MKNPSPLARAFPQALRTGPSEAMAWCIRLGQPLSGVDLLLVVCGHSAAVLATDRPEISVTRIGRRPSVGVSCAIAYKPTNALLQENDYA